MKLAVFTPWPHQPSGIADYAFDLILGLHKTGESVVVFTDLNTSHATRAAEVPVRPYSEFSREAEKYDCLLFQMGNNPHFHLWMLPLIQRYGGIVHLHDLVLQHLLAWNTYRIGNYATYFEMIERWYGKLVRNDVQELQQQKTLPWETTIVTEIPLFEEVVQHSDTCIVHSEFARQRVVSIFPGKECFVVPQLYVLPTAKLPKSERSTRRSIRVGVFGGVQPNRHVDIAIRALGESSKNSPIKVELIVVGEVAKDSENVSGLTRKFLHKNFSATFKGRVDIDEFHTLLSSCDLIISLRFPTMGETSAVVMKALQFCIPTIVTRTGWYGELPEIVRKIDPEGMEEQLILHLKEIFEGPNRLEIWKSECEKYADCYLNVEQAVCNYKLILNRVSGRQIFERQLTRGMLQLQLSNAAPAIISSIVDRVDAFLDH